MKQNTLTIHLVRTALVLFLFIGGASAQSPSNSLSGGESFTLEDSFRPGWREGMAGAGVLFSPVVAGPGRPTVNYGLAYAQAGYMLNDVSGDGFFRGNFEFAPDIFGAGIWHRTGNYIAGGTLWMRYNFVPRGSRFTPYFQLGAGAVSMDISHQYDGHNFNFNLEAGLGTRYFLNRNLALTAEFRYQHISNADTGSRNIGLNSIGPVLGVSWFF